MVRIGDNFHGNQKDFSCVLVRYYQWNHPLGPLFGQTRTNSLNHSRRMPIPEAEAGIFRWVVPKGGQWA
jgi:hypothetical protein